MEQQFRWVVLLVLTLINQVKLRAILVQLGTFARRILLRTSRVCVRWGTSVPRDLHLDQLILAKPARMVADLGSKNSLIAHHVMVVLIV